MLLDTATKGGTSAVPLVACLGLLQLNEAQLLSMPEPDSLLPALLSLPARLDASQQELLIESVSKFVSSTYGVDLLQEQIGPLRRG